METEVLIWSASCFAPETNIIRCLLVLLILGFIVLVLIFSLNILTSWLLVDEPNNAYGSFDLGLGISNALPGIIPLPKAEMSLPTASYFGPSRMLVTDS